MDGGRDTLVMSKLGGAGGRFGYYRVTKVLGDTDYVDIKMRVASSI